MNFCVVSREIREINKRGDQNNLRGVSKNHEINKRPPPSPVYFEPESTCKSHSNGVAAPAARSLLLHKKGCYTALQCFCAACNDCHACTRKSSNQNIARLATKGMLHASMLKNVAATVAKVTTSAGKDRCSTFRNDFDHCKGCYTLQ